MREKREIKFKNPFFVYLFTIITFGFYGIVWQVKSKRDMVAIGADIPTSWLLIVPFANFFWTYKWIAGYCHLKENGNPLLHFIGAVLFFPYALCLPYLIQSEINKHADKTPEPIEHAKAA